METRAEVFKSRFTLTQDQKFIEVLIFLVETFLYSLSRLILCIVC